MAYASLDDLRLRISEAELIRLTDEEDTGLADEDKIGAALEAAEVEIDSYLAGRYPLPLTATPPLLVPLACDLAIWNLYAIVEHAGVPEVRKERYQQAVAMLRRIADGTQTLGVAPQSVGSQAAVFTGPTKVFGRSSTGGL